MLLPARVVEGPRGMPLRLARLGSGTPVVLLHGYPENLQAWSAVAPRLAGRHEVLAFDWPGLGDSAPWPGGATPQAQADRLAELVRWWGLPSAHVVGLDMGGQPALAFAARHPELCRSVTACNSLLYGDEETSWEIRVLRRFGWNRLILRWLPRVVFLRAERTFLERGTRLDAEVRSDFWTRFRRPQARRFLVRLCAGYQGTLPGLPEVYRRIRAPCLAAWAEDDAHFPLVHARRLVQDVPGARLVVVRGAGHWMPLQRADEVADALLEHFERAEATPANLP